MATVAGSGAAGGTHSGAAASASIASPAGLAYDAVGNFYVVDTKNNQVDRVSSAGQLTIVAGDGTQGFAGDGGAAIAAGLNAPTGIAVGPDGAVFIADTGNHRVRRIAADGTITTIAGTGSAGYSGDGAAAGAARLRSPQAVAVDASGAVFVADTGNHRVRKIQTDGTVTTVAGNGFDGSSGDGGAATAASLQAPAALLLLQDGRLVVGDRQARRLRVLNTDGTIGAYPAAGVAALRRPAGLGSDGASNVYVADSANQRVLQLSPDGTSVLVGSGEQGAFSPGDPLQTPLDSPAGITATVDGGVLVSDAHNHQVQRLQLASLLFGSVPAGSTSSPQMVTLKNGGTGDLQVLSVDLPAGFVRIESASTCATPPFLLSSAADCTVVLAFAPVAPGAIRGFAHVRLNGAAPQALLLSGTAVAGGTLAGSLTSLAASGTISYAGAPLQLSAQVRGSLLAAPGGTVTFSDGSSTLGTVALSGSAATLTTADLLTGQHTLAATYSGDAVYRSSTSYAVTVTVVPAPDFTISAAAASYSGRAGGGIPIPLTLVPLNGTLNHTVQLTVSGLPTGVTATFTPSTFTLGGDSVHATLNVQLPATLNATGSATSLLPGLAFLFLPPCFLLRCSFRTAAGAGLLGLLAATAGCGAGYRAGTTSATLTGAGARTAQIVTTATTTGIFGAELAHSTSVALVMTP